MSTLKKDYDLRNEILNTKSEKYNNRNRRRFYNRKYKRQ